MKELQLLGHKVKDKITSQEGIVTSMSFDLYGCIQALVLYTSKKDGKIETDTKWFDVARLNVLTRKPVMDSIHHNANKGPEVLPKKA